MALTGMQKVRNVLLHALRLRGWCPVCSEDSGIYFKNSVYLVLLKNEYSSPAAVASANMRAGICSMIHQEYDGWWLEFEGFFIDSGKLPTRILSGLYPWDDSCAFEAHLEKFASTVDSVANKGRDELRSCVQKESKLRLGESTVGIQFAVSEDSVTSTRLFVCDMERFPRLSALFRPDEVYEIASFSDGNFRIVGKQENTEGGDMRARLLNTEQLERLIKCGAIIAVEEKVIKDEEIAYTYTPIFNGLVSPLPADFDSLHLTEIQKIYVGMALWEGINFTPLVRKGMGAAELKALLGILRKGIDSECILSTRLGLEQLEFLQGLADNGFPLDGFCIEGASKEYLSDKYSNVLSTVDARLSSDYSNLSEGVRNLARKTAFYFKGYEHILSEEPVMKLLLSDVKRRKPEFGFLCDLFFKYSVFEEEWSCKIYWSSLSLEEKNRVLGFLRDSRFFIGDVSFNDFLLGNMGKFLMLVFKDSGKFALITQELCVSFDYNSVFIVNGLSNILWRGTLINEKAYVYARDEFVDSVCADFAGVQQQGGVSLSGG